MGITAAILIVTAAWLASGYLFGATDRGYFGDHLEFAINLDESTLDPENLPTVQIIHEVDPSSESVLMSMPGRDIGASVDISLEAGTHPGAQWYCTSNVPTIEDPTDAKWSPLTTVQHHELRRSGSDHAVRTDLSNWHYPYPAVMCRREGDDNTAMYSKGHVSLAPARIWQTHNVDANIEYELFMTVRVPTTWERATSNEYGIINEGVIGGKNATSPKRGSGLEDPEVKWVTSAPLPLSFIDTEREADAERYAWISALVGGLGFGLIPPVLFRFH